MNVLLCWVKVHIHRFLSDANFKLTCAQACARSHSPASGEVGALKLDSPERDYTGYYPLWSARVELPEERSNRAQNTNTE